MKVDYRDIGIKDIDITEDEKIREIPITIKVGNLLSIHNVVEYNNRDEIKYYIFQYIRGMAVMNYTADEYKKIEEIIPINGITIFQDVDGHIEKIPFMYREK